MALTAPETAFDRARAAIATTPIFIYTFPWEPQPIQLELSKASVLDYVKEMRPWSYESEKTGGALLAIIGMTSFGLDVNSFMTWPTSSSDQDHSVLFEPEAAHELNLPVLSLQLGLLAAGAYALEAAARPLLARSASFTASSMATAQRSIGDMHSWVIVLRNLVAGAFVLAVPYIICKEGGLKSLIIGLSVAQVVITMSILLLWRFCEKAIWKMDGKVMDLVNLRMPHPEESFFDID
ncbi:hypothetical protein ACHAPE_001999 [Trichoderma viride]